MDPKAPIIAAALPEELAGVRGRFVPTERPARGVEFGRLAGRPCAVAVLGMGARTAGLCLSRALQALGPRPVIAVGAAGALTRDLAEGEVVEPTSISDAQGFLPCREGSRSRSCHLHSAPRLVHRPEDKAQLARQLGQKCAIVDLESAALARVCLHHGVPFATLRVVSDTWEEALPEFLRDAEREDGSLDRWRIVRHIALRPWIRVPEALRTARRMRVHAESLVEALLATPW